MSATVAAQGECAAPIRVDLALLRCPTTGQALHRSTSGRLVSADGEFAYPVIGSVPVIINERRSTFKLADYQTRPEFSPTLADTGRVFQWLDRWLPSLTLNLGSRENFRQLAELVHAEAQDGMRPRLLVVGAGSGGEGSEELLSDPRVDSVEVDVALGARTDVVCDAHDLPFASGAFDAVVCQAVLEHVLDPARVVAEIHRVLAPGGLVYSEVPFMQQVHGGAYDVTRFSLVGHRRLYRFFDEIQSGVQGGPGMALGWSAWYLLRTLARSRSGRGVAFMVARLLFSWLKYLDLLLGSRPAATDAASGTFFLGRRREDAVSDEAILSGYRGAGSCRLQ
jgi:SAM-dependent methyltransferase